MSSDDRVIEKLAKLLEGRYKVDSILSRNTNSINYRATTSNGKAVILKVVRDELSIYFDQEITMMKMLVGCPHVVQYIDDFKIVNNHVYVTELYTDSLYNMYTQLSYADLMQIACDAAVGLREMHIKGILHLNIGPANIMVHKGRGYLYNLEDSMTIGDFKKKWTGSSVLPTNNALWCRPPELFFCEHDDHLGNPIDVWGLGITFAWILRRLAGHNNKEAFPWNEDTDELQCESMYDYCMMEMQMEFISNINTILPWTHMLIPSPRKRVTMIDVCKMIMITRIDSTIYTGLTFTKIDCNGINVRILNKLISKLAIVTPHVFIESDSDIQYMCNGRYKFSNKSHNPYISIAGPKIDNSTIYRTMYLIRNWRLIVYTNTSLYVEFTNGITIIFSEIYY